MEVHYISAITRTVTHPFTLSSANLSANFNSISTVIGPLSRLSICVSVSICLSFTLYLRVETINDIHLSQQKLSLFFSRGVFSIILLNVRFITSWIKRIKVDVNVVKPTLIFYSIYHNLLTQ